MTFWKWKALDSTGKIYRGLTKGETEQRIIVLLRSRGLYTVSLNPDILGIVRIWLYSWDSLLFWARTSRKISTLLLSGIPLLKVLDILADREGNRLKRNQWQEVCHKVRSGHDLSFSLKEFIPFPGTFVESMILAGEKSGNLENNMLKIAEQLEQEYFFRKKIRSALFYPLLLLTVALAVVYILSTVILPMYETLFAGMEVSLPLITRMLLTAGPGLPYFLMLVTCLVSLYMIFGKGKLPVFPGMQKIRKLKTLQQFCALLSSLLDAGIPLLESLTLLERIIPGKEASCLTENMKNAVREGKKITPVLLSNSFFPSEAARMMEIAEESGRLSEMSGYVSGMFKQELEEKLRQYPKILEPLLVLGMAGLVGLVAVGMLLPIFDLSMHIR